MSNLTRRQENILAYVIHEYVETAKPIGSRLLASKYGLDISTATIRKEFAQLEELGYLTHPHTSAGRVPTDRGYSYFVQRLMGDADLPLNEQRTIAHQFHQSRLDLNQWLQLAATVLARSTNIMRPDGVPSLAWVSLVTPPQAHTARVKHVQLISTQGRLVLMILVFEDGTVKQEMFTLAEALSQEELSAASVRLTEFAQGQTASRLQARRNTLSEELDREVLQLLLDLIQRSGESTAGEVYRDGLTEVLKLPEYEGREMAESLVAVLEQRPLLEEVLNRTLGPSVDSVHVVIGGVSGWSELRDLSMVLARYGVSNYSTGTIGVLGPTRMPYGRAVSTVRYVSHLLSDLISQMATR